MKIFLIGMRGVGKTTAGELLARRLKLPFLDTDREVERLAGQPIRAIFAQEGEMAFREQETRALREIEKSPRDAVVATGGGILLRPENQVLLPRLGKVVYLHAKPELLRRRLAGSSDRPSLLGRPVEEEVEFLYLTRDPLYRDAADLLVAVDGKSPDEICEEVEARLSRVKKRLPKRRKKE